MTDAAARHRGGRPPPGLAVAAAGVALLVSLPLVYLVVRAASGGLEAAEVLLRPGIAWVIVRTVVLVVAVGLAASVVGVGVAYLVTRTDLPGRSWLAVAAALPLVIPSYVGALALIAAFGPSSPLEAAVGALPGVGGPPDVFGFPGAFVALTASTYPYVFLLTAAALRGSDPALEEAGRSLGLSPRATFARITLPLVRPAVLAGALLSALYTLSDFGVVSLMRHDVLTRVIFVQYQSLFDRTPAAVLGLVLVVLTGVVLALEAWARGRARPAPAPTGRRGPVQPLGRWRWAALAFVLGVVGTALVVPIAVLLYWALARGGRLSLVALAEPAAGSLLVGLVTAALAVTASLPLAALAARYPRRWTRGLERLAFGGNALPGVVVALALVFFAVRYAPVVYQSLGLLVFAYLVRFLPQALAGARAAMLGVGVRLEEAARSLGRTPRGAFAAVTLPLLAPGLLASGALVFLSTMKELPATLILRPTGFETLATEVWTETSVAAYSDAAVPALALVVISAPVVLRLLALPERTAAGRRDGAERGPPSRPGSSVAG